MKLMYEKNRKLNKKYPLKGWTSHTYYNQLLDTNDYAALKVILKTQKPDGMLSFQ